MIKKAEAGMQSLENKQENRGIHVSWRSEIQIRHNFFIDTV